MAGAEQSHDVTFVIAAVNERARVPVRLKPAQVRLKPDTTSVGYYECRPGVTS